MAGPSCAQVWFKVIRAVDSFCLLIHILSRFEDQCPNQNLTAFLYINFLPLYKKLILIQTNLIRNIKQCRSPEGDQKLVMSIIEKFIIF